ncbi:hypothetical protein ACH4A6_21620 [Streptomyces atroolivaceus]|uniref:hypothetical protein n=1 Tax=Streptomyces atroolivaceus TaxID=66869 RepID=UPI00378F782E
MHGLGAEREAVVVLIDSWDDIPHEQIVTCVPTNQMASETATTLAEHGILAVDIRPDGPRGDGGVHIGTVFRFKGLEYQRMVVAGVSDGLIPRDDVNRRRDTDPIAAGR